MISTKIQIHFTKLRFENDFQLKLNIFKDYNINIKQDWLNKYELEYYVLYYVLKKNLKFKEVPIKAAYPKVKKNYTKIKPFSGWWSMIRPWVLLKFGIRK